jgi:hypothetical protein
MKKFSLVLAALVLFAGVSFANPVVKQDKKTDKTEKKSTKKGGKTEKKKDDTKKAK